MAFALFGIIMVTYNFFRAKKKAENIICKKPNDFWNVIAPPGTGKTCLAASIVRKAKREGKKVYSNVPIRGAIQIDIKKDLGVYRIEHAKLIIDEAGSDLSNRNWQRNLTSEAIDWIKKHRHYDVDIYTFSQAPGDMDNKFRDLVTRMFLLEKCAPFRVKALALQKVMKLEGGQIVEYLEEFKEETFKFFTPPTWAWFNSWDKEDYFKEMDEKIYTILDVK